MTNLLITFNVLCEAAGAVAGVLLLIYPRKYVGQWAYRFASGGDGSEMTPSYAATMRRVGFFTTIVAAMLLLPTLELLISPSVAIRQPVADPGLLQAYDRQSIPALAAFFAIVTVYRIAVARGRIRSDALYWGGAVLFAVGGFFAARYHIGPMADLSGIIGALGFAALGLSLSPSPV